MANTYVWKFESLDVYPTYQAFTNVVESIHWRLNADDGSGHTATAYGELKAGPVDPENFTPFVELTSTQVQGWTESLMGTELAALTGMLDQRIMEQVSPTVVAMSPPWL